MTASRAAVAGAEPDLIVRREGAAGVIRLNRPKAINAVTLEMFREIDKALDDDCVVRTRDGRVSRHRRVGHGICLRPARLGLRSRGLRLHLGDRRYSVHRVGPSRRQLLLQSADLFARRRICG